MKPADTVPAAAAPWTQTATGKALPLGRAIEPGLLDIRRDIAQPLGNTGRFANQMPSGQLYSVAQHCCIGADTLFGRTRDVALALAFLCHEAHEGPLGDWTEPVLAAMQAALDDMRRAAGDVSGPALSIREIKRRLADPIDRYVHAEAGLPWPLPRDMRAAVHLMDRQMLLVERDHLLARPPKPWDEALERLPRLNLKHRIKILPPARAAEAWIMRFESWAPKVHAARLQAGLPLAVERTREAAQ